MKADAQFWRELKQQRNNMTKQQYRTIKGQAVKGNMDAARGRVLSQQSIGTEGFFTLYKSGECL